MKKLVSILMPAKNASLYIEDCIHSILNQSFAYWELIVVNDHSNDQTYKILETFAKQDDRINIYQNNGSGIIHALRLAYSRSQGEYITRMDADDLMPSNKLASLLNACKAEDTLATGLVSYFSKKGIGDGYRKYSQWLNTNLQKAQPFDDIYKECVIPSPCWMMHRSMLDKVDAFEPDRYPEDYDLCFRMHQYGLKVNTVPEVLHHWRDYPERSSRTGDNYADNRYLALKVQYFLKLENDNTRPLYLWGSGKKGKEIAKLLKASQVSFQWITNNANKIGHNIYDFILAGEESLANLDRANVIIAIAGTQDQKYIRNKLAGNKGLQGYWFC